MDTIATALVVIFYGAMFVALLYFVHKVLWFVKLRSLQGALVADAERKVREATTDALSAWDKSADTSWSSAAASPEDEGPVAYVRRIERLLSALDASLEQRERAGGAVRTWFLDHLSRSPSGETVERLDVLMLPRVEGGEREVVLEVRFPRIRRPNPPPRELYELQVRSRYGLWRRALAFVLGAADVVYSSSHVARMSQNVEVPASVIVRRLSLVAVILGAILLDIVFSLRARLIEAIDELLGPGPHLVWLGGIGELFGEHLATGLALVLWLAVYGAIYFGLYLFLRRRSQASLHRLEQLRARRQDDLDAIYDHHVGELSQWAKDYARTLDEAVAIGTRQARLLVGRTMRRLRRRLASAPLIAAAESMAARLFSQLPEASVGLQDAATQHQHGLAHAIWPRVEEMGYQVDLARTRAAWRRIEAGLAELRVEHPDPAAARGLWRTLAVVARMFPDLVSDEGPEAHSPAALEAAFEASVADIVERTERDLEELGQRLDQLADGLGQQLSIAGSLLETQVELAEQAMEAEVAELAAELLETREGARLEAMAFEI